MLRVNQPGELLAAVPYMLGFHPSDSLVVIGVKDGHLQFAARADLPACEHEALASLAAVTARQHPDTTILIGYGTEAAVTPRLATAREALAGRKIPVLEALRLTDGRYYSYDCPEASCCPPEGRVHEPDTTVAAAEATLAGQVALASRAELEASVEPVPEPGMKEASGTAETRMIARLAKPGGRKGLIMEGAALLEVALSRYYTGGTLTTDETAWLLGLLLFTEIRDAAWRLIELRPQDQHLPLWADVTRRAERGRGAPAATLLAYAAYTAGQGSLAVVALDRALADDPEYALADLLGQAIASGIPPRKLRTPRARRIKGKRRIRRRETRA
ncbi:DUF4192 domain-containing protein [Longispora albida]|uniref:DUF4192 domain-containing protein n=1 Tax=Longispora albida TaxID=203523 RepID=UPI0005900610|nr:DUF4192 domain-containing protein [Longispora albida]